VSDEHGKTLGLVYSSGDSILEAIRSGRGVYYSRSRGGLWRKGDTSGAWQQLLSIHLDCDSDAVLFRVKQMGAIAAFCHLNTRTCWGEDSGLTALESVLKARMHSAPAGSYTKRLFDDPTLLRNKLMEEAQELSEAVEPDHVAAEAADLLYFALTACVKAGVGLKEIEAHLDHRALKIKRRPGDSKQARIAAAEAHFKDVAEKEKQPATAPVNSA
jgi:phosphoribosyl-ATP pyrophosphohydrolase/phosphoribosyl-AMP cyclohydrolase/histidinol dehydrogenase